jgi:hypothetical protein
MTSLVSPHRHRVPSNTLPYQEMWCIFVHRAYWDTLHSNAPAVLTKDVFCRPSPPLKVSNFLFSPRRPPLPSYKNKFGTLYDMSIVVPQYSTLHLIELLATPTKCGAVDSRHTMRLDHFPVEGCAISFMNFKIVVGVFFCYPYYVSIARYFCHN